MTKLLMFPGQGSQYPGMGKDWYENFQEAKLAFEEASDGSGLNLKKLCFEGSVDDLKQTEVTQPALLATTIAIYRSVAKNQELNWEYVAGHSLGEYSALCAAGVISLFEASKIVRSRGKYMQEAVPVGIAGMSALIFKPGTINSAELSVQLCFWSQKKSNKIISVANFNSQEQIVVAGHHEALKCLEEIASDPKYSVRKIISLPVSAPFHSQLMQPAAEKLSPELNAIKWNPVQKFYVANVDAQIHEMNVTQVLSSRLEEQMTASVRWVESIQNLINHNCLDAIEIGPGTVLSGLVKRIKVGEQTMTCKNVDKFEEYKNVGYI